MRCLLHSNFIDQETKQKNKKKNNYILSIYRISDASICTDFSSLALCFPQTLCNKLMFSFLCSEHLHIASQEIKKCMVDHLCSVF